MSSKNLFISFSAQDDKNWMIVVRLLVTVSRLEVCVVSREWNFPYKIRISIGKRSSRWSLLMTPFVSSKLKTTISWRKCFPSKSFSRCSLQKKEKKWNKRKNKTNKTQTCMAISIHIYRWTGTSMLNFEPLSRSGTKAKRDNNFKNN